MVSLSIVIFAVTLIYLAIANRPVIQNRILGVQGVLLFIVAFFQIGHFEWLHVVVILGETILVKAIAIPLFLERIRRHNEIIRTHALVPGHISVIIVTNIIIFSFVLSSSLHNDHLQTRFFAIAIASMLTGMYFIVSNRNVYAHLIGYLVIENGIFLLSLAVGSEMPMLVNMAIVLDISFGALILGVFINRVGRAFNGTDISFLSSLKD